MSKIHEIYLNLEFCDDVLLGKKSFEVRENDRGYQTGDFIKFKANSGSLNSSLNEKARNHPINNEVFRIEYMLNGWGIKNGYVALAIKIYRGEE